MDTTDFCPLVAVPLPEEQWLDEEFSDFGSDFEDFGFEDCDLSWFDYDN